MAKRTIWDRLFGMAESLKDKELRLLLDEAKEEAEAKAKDSEDPTSGDAPVQVHVHNGGGESDQPWRDHVADLHKKLGDCMTKMGDHESRLKDAEGGIAEHGKRLDELEKDPSGAEVTGGQDAAGGDPLKEDPSGAKVTGGQDAAAEAKEKAEKEAADKRAKDEAAKKEEEEKEGMKDSKGMSDVWRDTVARGEILMPGFKPGKTFDAKAKKKDTVSTLCQFRRDAMVRAVSDPKRKIFVDKAFGGKAEGLDSMPCDAVWLAFNAASEFARDAANSSASVVDAAALAAQASKTSGGMTPAALQKRNEEFRKGIK